MNREALATLSCALLVFAFFWAALLLFKDSGEMLLSLPLWFVISCLGGYVLSIVLTLVLIKKFMVDFPLDEEEPGRESGQISGPGGPCPDSCKQLPDSGRPPADSGRPLPESGRPLPGSGGSVSGTGRTIPGPGRKVPAPAERKSV